MSAAAPSLVLRNVAIAPSVRGFDATAGRFDVHIQNHTVCKIFPTRPVLENTANSDANPGSVFIQNGTLLPALVDLHVHIDKTFVVDETGPCEGDLLAGIGLMAQHRSQWSAAHIRTRMERALQQAYGHGTRALRTHLDWMDATPPKALAVWEALRNTWRDRLTQQAVSLTPLDYFDDVAGSAALAQHVADANQRCDTTSGEAVLLGAFVYRNTGMEPKLQRVFDLASLHGLNLDFHVDEGLDPDACGLRTIARLALRQQFKGRITCGHVCSLAMQPLDEALETLQLCKEAQMDLVSLPSTNLYLQGAWDQTPVPRGITRLTEANAIGLKTSIATDNVADGFFPYGSYDLLDNWALGVQAAHLSPADAWLAAATTHPAQAMGLPWNGKIAEGCPADLVLLNAQSPFELISPQGRQRRIIRAGKLL